MVDLPQVAVHYAVTSLFEDDAVRDRVYCYRVEREHGRTFRAGRSRLALGRARVTSELTGDSALLSYGVLHFGDHNLNAGVRAFEGEEAYGALVAGAGKAFEHGDLAQVIRLLDRAFLDVSYSLRSLFRDEQRRILDLILASTLEEAEEELHVLFHHHAPLMRFLNSLGTPLPNAFRATAELVLNLDLKRVLADPGGDPDEVRRLLEETSELGITLDVEGLSYVLERALEERVERLRERPEEPDLLARAEEAVDLALTPPFQVSLWRVQNRCYEMLTTVQPLMKEEAEAGETEAARWVERFRSLAEKLQVRAE
jgi:hypothetical protein